MADPFTIIGVGASVAGGLLGAFGAEKKGAADSQMYQYQAATARMNQQIALKNAGYAQVAGGSAALQEGQKIAANRAQITTAQAASGIDINSGSAKQVRDDTTKLGIADQNIIRTNYARKAYGYETEAANKGAEAGGAMAASSNAESAGDINAMSSIIGGVSNVASKWQQGSRTGMFT